MRYQKRFSRSSRRSYKKRFSPKKYYSKRYPVRKAIVKIAKQVKEIRKDEELKVVSNQTTSFSGTPIFTTLAASAPQYMLLNGLQRGTQYNTRLADKVRATSIQCDIELFFTGIHNVGGVDAEVRIMLVCHKKPRGQALALCTSAIITGTTGLFYNPSGNPYVWEHIDWGIGTNAYEQYKVLYDKRHRLATKVAWYDGSNAQTVNPSVYINLRKKLGAIVDYGRGNSGTVSDLETNSYYLIFITDTTQTISANIDTRFYYKDA